MLFWKTEQRELLSGLLTYLWNNLWHLQVLHKYSRWPSTHSHTLATHGRNLLSKLYRLSPISPHNKSQPPAPIDVLTVGLGAPANWLMRERGASEDECGLANLCPENINGWSHARSQRRHHAPRPTTELSKINDGCGRQKTEKRRGNRKKS